jgi:hypothetical protein
MAGDSTAALVAAAFITRRAPASSGIRDQRDHN